MTTEKLYRLMDLLEELKQLDAVLSMHEKSEKPKSDIMILQYKAKKEQLLVYFINEINASIDNEHTPQRLELIKKMMERFYSSSGDQKKHNFKPDDKLDQLFIALSA